MSYCVNFSLQTPLKRKSITFDETAPPSNDSKPKPKFAKTPIRSGGHKGVYQPPQGKYSSSFDRYGKICPANDSSVV